MDDLSESLPRKAVEFVGKEEGEKTNKVEKEKWQFFKSQTPDNNSQGISSSNNNNHERLPAGGQSPIARTRLATLAQIGEDWLYLALLGIIMALLSFSMDSMITFFLSTRLWLFTDLNEDNVMVQYLGWCVMPIVLVIFSTAFVYLCSPTAIGSGIPEMKTILRGVVLNEYLTFRTLVAKVVGLTFTLGSGLPLGKEGPFVHMASIVATLLSKLVASFQGIYENESRTSEMLSAACAVGVAATFYAPIGGVLFSIEITTVYFAVRNYWRGFFAACCGATVWRLLSFWVTNDESLSALFRTNFRTDYPFDPIELLVFSFIGATCGLAAAAYIKFHREIVQFFRRHKRISGFLQKNRFVYPILVTLVITSVTFPPLLGKYTASQLSTHTTIEHLFSNRTWSLGNQDLVSKAILDHWTTPSTGFHLHLVLYIAMLFWTSALASTIPIPSGLFIPVLKMGAAYGRLLGELMHQIFPEGIKFTDFDHPASHIIPGSYAVVGAAAFSGAVTHTISTSVILFEMTGQIVHIIPVILGVLIANAVCQSLQPSIYDSIIEIKKLPYLPPIASSNSLSHRILVKDFMNTKLGFVWKNKCTYADLKALLATHRKIISFPLVESRQSMKLLGSVPRSDLLKLLYLHLGRERRLQEVCRRTSETVSPAATLGLLNTASGKLEQIRAASQLPSVSSGIEFAILKVGSSSSSRSSSSSSSSSSAASSPSPSRPSSPAARLSVREKQTTNSEPAKQKALASSQTILRSDLIPALNYGSLGRIELLQSGAVAESSRYNPMGHQVLPSNRTEEKRDQETLPRLLGTKDDHSEEEEEDLDDGPTEAGEGEEEEEDGSGNDGAGSSESNLENQGVARIVNQYNRGSSMDEEKLIESKQELERQIAASVAIPEIVVILEQSPKGSRSDAPSLAPSNDNSPEQQRQWISPNQPLRKNAITEQRRPLSPLVELRPASSFSLATPAASRSPSLSSRPTKSILKTSRTAANFSHMYKRNVSSASFASALEAGRQVFSDGSNLDRLQRTSLDTTLNKTVSLTDNQMADLEQSAGAGQRAAMLGFDQYPFSLGSVNLSANMDNGCSSLEQTPQMRQRRKVRLPRLRVVDMTPEEQEQWEKEQLNAHIDISTCQIDEAPFQLVEQTSLYRVHTLFSMLGLNHAYVTSFGCLVGIVALKDIRYAIENMLQER